MKRFTETTKWFDPWFMDLPIKHKLFWFYICEQCDNAGIWEPNVKLAQMLIGEPIDLVDVLRVFRGRIEQLPNGKFWVKTFIEFQYGVLSPDCKPHLPIIKRLENLGLRQRVSIPFPKGLDTLEEKEQEKEKDKKGSPEGGKMTKYGLPLPPRCSIRPSDGAVLDYTGRTMDINQVRKAQPK